MSDAYVPGPAPIHPPLPAGEAPPQDATTAGQRRVNLIWEITQSLIALIMVSATVAAALHLVFRPTQGGEIPNILSVLCGMVVGSYFQRTNHMNIGGVGRKPTDYEPYRGR